MTEVLKDGSRMKGKSSAPPGIIHVDQAPCPAHEGDHELTNTATGKTRCFHCGKSWAELDEELNSAKRKRPNGTEA